MNIAGGLSRLFGRAFCVSRSNRLFLQSFILDDESTASCLKMSDYDLDFGKTNSYVPAAGGDGGQGQFGARSPSDWRVPGTSPCGQTSYPGGADGADEPWFAEAVSTVSLDLAKADDTLKAFTKEAAGFKIEAFCEDNKITNKDKEVVGINVSAKTIKNKVAPPFRTVNFEIHFGIGIKEHEQVFDLLRKHGPETVDGKEVSVGGSGTWKRFRSVMPRQVKSLLRRNSTRATLTR